MPDSIARPDYADHPNGRSLSEEAFRGNTTIKVLNDEEIEAMHVSCRLGREVLDEAAKAIDIGVTTDEIDRVVHEACIERDCYPSPLNYYNFPKSCCTSVNEVICHGIPDTRKLQVRNCFWLNTKLARKSDKNGNKKEEFIEKKLKHRHKNPL